MRENAQAALKYDYKGRGVTLDFQTKGNIPEAQVKEIFDEENYYPSPENMVPRSILPFEVEEEQFEKFNEFKGYNIGTLNEIELNKLLSKMRAVEIALTRISFMKEDAKLRSGIQRSGRGHNSKTSNKERQKSQRPGNKRVQKSFSLQRQANTEPDIIPATTINYPKKNHVIQGEPEYLSFPEADHHHTTILRKHMDNR